MVHAAEKRAAMKVVSARLHNRVELDASNWHLDAFTDCCHACFFKSGVIPVISRAGVGRRDRQDTFQRRPSLTILTVRMERRNCRKIAPADIDISTQSRGLSHQ